MRKVFDFISFILFCIGLFIGLERCHQVLFPSKEELEQVFKQQGEI